MAVSYGDWLLSQGLSDRTVVIYQAKLNRALEIAGRQGWDLRRVTPTQVAAIAEQFPLSSATRRQLRTALVHYWGLHDTTGPAKAVRVPKKPRGVYRGLEPDEAKLLAKTAHGWWPTGGPVLLGLYLGLRREEMATLRWEQFDRDLEWITILGKGQVTRTLPVHPTLKADLQPNITAHRWVFPGRTRAHCHPATVWKWVEEVSDAAGVRITRPHMLRHTCLATMNDHTKDLRTTQEFAGHARPETTAIYTRTTAQRLTDAMVSLDYLD